MPDQPQSQVELREALEKASRYDFNTVSALLQLLSRKKEVAEWALKGILRPHVQVEETMKHYDNQIKQLLGIL